MNKEELHQLEVQANTQPKSLSCLAVLMLFFPFFMLGLFYWFVDDIFFDYDLVSPFSGFFIFFIIAVLVIYLANIMVQRKWKDFNEKIKKSKEEIIRLINSEELEYEDLFRLKRNYVEKRIEENKITRPEFQWHNNQVCWGCGELHRDQKYDYKYVKKRNVSWKKGAVRYSTVKEQEAHIYLCPTCYKAAIATDKDIKSTNRDITFFNIIASILLLIFYFFDIFGFFVSMEYEWILLLIIFTPIGQYALAFIYILISSPFRKKKKYFTPKWDFDRIPVIRSFLERDFSR